MSTDFTFAATKLENIVNCANSVRSYDARAMHCARSAFLESHFIRIVNMGDGITVSGSQQTPIFGRAASLRRTHRRRRRHRPKTENCVLRSRHRPLCRPGPNECDKFAQLIMVIGDCQQLGRFYAAFGWTPIGANKQFALCLFRVRHMDDNVNCERYSVRSCLCCVCWRR